MRIVAPPGTVDILPEEVRMDRYVESVFMEKCRLFGYSEIHTPVFEYGDLFTKGIGSVTDIIEKELYTFTDKSGTHLALRPEGTTSVTRAVLQHDLCRSLPAKFCYKITCYRQENPEKGRLREFHQIGAECFGSDDPRADAEVISLAYESLKAMGVQNLRLNINSVGCERCRVGYINELTRYLLPYANKGKLCPTCLKRLGKNPIRVLDCKNPDCKAVAKGAPKIIDYICPDCLEHYNGVKAQLAAMGMEYNEKPGLMRGLDYYSRTVFDFKAGSGGAIGTVCGGGRYDALCRRIGSDKELPAVGFAIGEERVVIAMSEQSPHMAEPERPAAYVVSADAAIAAVCLLELRKRQIYAEGDIIGLGETAQLSRANSLSARWLLFSEENGLRLKNAKTGAEQRIGANEWDKAVEIISEK